MGEVLIGGTSALLICIFLSPKFIAFLRAREFGQQIRDEGPAGHHAKAGTPTMGGIIMFLAISIPFLILVDYHDARALGVYGAAMACAALGLLDDAQKVFRRRNLGLRGRWKLLVTVVISLFLWWIAVDQAGLDSTLRLRTIDATIDLGPFYPVLIYLVVAGTSNAVNLTDGLDGLAAGCAAIVLLTYLGITFISGGQKELALLCGCLVGACIGFLWFNAFPATIFMGDTGSLGLGGAIAGYFRVVGFTFPGMKEIYAQFGLPGVITPQLSFATLTLGPAVIFAFTLAAALYPALRIRRLRPVEAMRAA